MGSNPVRGFTYKTLSTNGALPLAVTEGYGDYLARTVTPRVARVRLRLSQEFGHVLQSGDAAPLLTLPQNKRLLVMKSLSSLARFKGVANHWKEIRTNYGLTWTEDFDAFSHITDESKSLDAMMAWVDSALCLLPRAYGDALRFNLLCGLRPSESLLAMDLLRQSPDYLKDGLLQHYKYPSLFIRRTKKAFVSVYIEEMDGLLSEKVNYNALRLRLYKSGLGCNVEYCRQIFATKLRLAGIQPEIIDLLQGRIPKSVFVRHYYRPNFKEELAKVRLSLTVNT